MIAYIAGTIVATVVVVLMIHVIVEAVSAALVRWKNNRSTK